MGEQRSVARLKHGELFLIFLKAALYNFESTFSGTHFVSPRAFQGQVGVTF
jgi:hypothetical protein